MTGIRQITDLPVVVCRTFFRHDSEEIAMFAKSMAQAGAAAVGTNCVGGPRSLLPIIEQLCAVSDLPVVAMPNAGFPTVQNGQTFYHLAPDYLKRYAQRFRDLGVAVIGGCCGVGAEHIAAIHEQLDGQSLVERDPQTQRLTSKTVMVRQHPFARSLQDPERFPLLAMVPGRLSDREANRALKELADAGASAVGLLAGWPGAGGSGNLTARLRRGQDASQRPAVLELPAESLSLAEAQSALYDAALLGIDTVLVDAGVFSGLAGRPGSGCDPRRLITLIADHNRGYDLQGVRLEEPTRFAIGVRLGRDDLEQAEEFAAAGAHFCTMQPIYEPQAFREAMASYDSDLPLMAEILILSDAETADELDNEVPVLSVPKKLRERLAENPEEDVEGVLTFLRYWRGALAGAVIMLPDARTEQAVSLISQLHSTAEAP